MKKSELTQLTQIIEHIVAKEVRKQLPGVIAEVFQNMMGKSVVTEKKQPIREEIVKGGAEEPVDFRASLKELFAGTPVMKAPEPAVRQPKQYTKNPVLNQILNETTSDLRARESLVGAAAFQGGYSPSMAMVPGFSPPGTGPAMMEGASPEPEFTRKMPTIPVGRPPVLVEGQASTHAPLSALPEGISALDAVKYVETAPEVKQALTRNYSEMMKILNKKKK